MTTLDEAALAQDIHRDLESSAQFLLQPSLVKEGGPRSETHEQVEIALWTVLAARDRPDNQNLLDMEAPGNGQDRITSLRGNGGRSLGHGLIV